MIKLKLEWELTRDSDIEDQFHIAYIIFILTIAYVVLSFLFSRWKQYKQLKNAHLKAQLDLLKSKIDPHFFFNTLNNLYGLVIEKSDEAGPVILKLSEIMRYTIYNGEKDLVSLKDEILYLQQYIDIHKIRYKKRVTIEFTDDIEDRDFMIAPLLYINLLENAFKHGIENLADNAFLDINLIAAGNHISFIIKNNYEVEEIKEGGHGLDNLKQRLELLYPTKHQLSIQQSEDLFRAQLDIWIS